MIAREIILRANERGTLILFFGLILEIFWSMSGKQEGCKKILVENCPAGACIICLTSYCRGLMAILRRKTHSSLKIQREKAIADLVMVEGKDGYCFSVDNEFNSPSQSASVVSGNRVSGLDVTA